MVASARMALGLCLAAACFCALADAREDASPPMDTQQRRRLLQAPSGSMAVSSLDGSSGFTVYGRDVDDRLGHSVAFGDVNGDGYQDLIMGCNFADGSANAAPNAGEVSVVLGKASGWAASVQASQLDGSDGFVVYGRHPSDEMGSSVSSGDINGDGYDDIIIGAPGTGPDSQQGEVYVVFGRPSWASAASIRVQDLSGADGFVVTGSDANDNMGNAVASGDVNGDGIADVICGAKGARAQGNGKALAGEVYVVFGKVAGWAAAMQAASLDGASGFVIYGEDSGDWMGFSVASGDVNGDGISDVIMGAESGDGAGNAKTKAGGVYVVFGKASAWPAAVQAGSLAGSDGFVVHGADGGDRLGTSVASCDVNGDGKDDVVMGGIFGGGADNTDTFAGDVYVLFGKASGWTASVQVSALNGTSGFAIYGKTERGLMGNAVSCGDVNGDGFDEIVMGARKGNSGSEGEAWVVMGKASGWAAGVQVSGLSGSEGDGFQIKGRDADDEVGSAVSIGDTNGDGFGDLLVGAQFGDGLADTVQSNRGEAYAVFGVGKAAKCAAGEYDTNHLSGGSASCAACTAGYYCNGIGGRKRCGAHSSSPASSKVRGDCVCDGGYFRQGVACLACAAPCQGGATFQTQACTPSSNRVCAACGAACGAGSYQTAACTAASDRQCSACAAPCRAGGEYETQACTGTTNRECKACSASCVVGTTYESTSCGGGSGTGGSDRVCTPCSAACVPGVTAESRACTGTLDRVCVPIAGGSSESLGGSTDSISTKAAEVSTRHRADMEVEMGIALQEFDGRRDDFKAAVLGITDNEVGFEYVKVSEAGGGSGRRAGGSVEVWFRIFFEEAAQSVAAAGSLQPDRLNPALKAAGLPEVTVLVAAKATSDSANNKTVGIAVGSTFGGLAFLGLLCCGGILVRRKLAERGARAVQQPERKGAPQEVFLGTSMFQSTMSPESAASPGRRLLEAASKKAQDEKVSSIRKGTGKATKKRSDASQEDAKPSRESQGYGLSIETGYFPEPPVGPTLSDARCSLEDADSVAAQNAAQTVQEGRIAAKASSQSVTSVPLSVVGAGRGAGSTGQAVAASMSPSQSLALPVSLTPQSKNPKTPPQSPEQSVAATVAASPASATLAPPSPEVPAFSNPPAAMRLAKDSDAKEVPADGRRNNTASDEVAPASEIDATAGQRIAALLSRNPPVPPASSLPRLAPGGNAIANQAPAARSDSPEPEQPEEDAPEEPMTLMPMQPLSISMVPMNPNKFQM